VSRIAILGASSKLGQQLISRAIEAEHRVNALTRDARNIQRANEALSVFVGDAETGEGLGPLLAGCSVVISAINSPQLAQCTTHLVKALTGHPKLERWIVLSWVGVGDTAAQATRTSAELGTLRRRIERPMYEEIGRAEGIVRTSRLPWVLLRCTRLTDDVGKEVVATDATADPPRRVGRADLARFIIGSLEEPNWVHREASVGAKR
jgi:uncharacterized protein YbjT (DUF2867 family)